MDPISQEYPFRAVLDFSPLLDYLGTISADSAEPLTSVTAGIRQELADAPELLGPIEDFSLLERHATLVKRLMNFVFPLASWNSEASAAVVPFSVRPVHASPPFRQLFLNPDGSMRGRLNVGADAFNRGRLIRAFLFVLEQCYGVRQEFDYPMIRIVKDPETGLERHYKMNLDFRFVRVRALKEVKPLTAEERETVLQHLTEPEVLAGIIPPRNFELHGFTVMRGVDVTATEILSGLGRDLIDQESVVSREGFQRLQQRLRTLFRQPELIAGLAVFQDEQVLLLNTGCEMNRCCIFADTRHVPKQEFRGSVFEKAVERREIVWVSDLQEHPRSTRAEQEFSKLGVRSLMIAPLEYGGECIGTLDLGSPSPGTLGPMEAMSLSQIQPLFAMAIKKALDDLQSRVQGLIKEKCTAIHPSVEWRFRRAALRHFEALRKGEASEIEPIVFRDVYPVYGVSDIRGSATARNRAIQKDLAEHLRLAMKVVESAGAARPLLILDELAGRIGRRLDLIQRGLGTGDELSIANFLAAEVESLFPLLRTFGLKSNRAIDAYEEAVDSEKATVYRLRREFEDSISLLNERLTGYLDREEAELQGVFPHYFERHRTDGVDYLVYMGESLLEEGGFNELYLKNMRLWQLKVACGMAWHTEQLKSSLKVPLDTAHLVLVQNTPLSIRFRYDEKRFDVDGAYDIRHEIIKSRIDKAVVKGRRERLTQPGRIAVVYSHPEEAQEMMRHIEFLRSQGYLHEGVEDLELEDLSGVQGLRSLRVKVDLESRVLQSAHRHASTVSQEFCRPFWLLISFHNGREAEAPNPKSQIRNNIKIPMLKIPNKSGGTRV